MDNYKQSITRNLAEAQEQHAKRSEPSTIIDTVFTLYTEYRDNLEALILRYFDGATVHDARGYWKGASEASAVIEIIASASALQDIVNLAGDIKHVNGQDTVLVTWQRISVLEV